MVSAMPMLFWTITIGAVPTVLNALFAHLVRSEGYSKQASFGMALGGVLNIILDPIFISVFGLEIAGAAIATMLSNLIATLYFILLIFGKRKSTVIALNPK
jgi:Na+-driven multidrug efflux pump